LEIAGGIEVRLAPNPHLPCFNSVWKGTADLMSGNHISEENIALYAVRSCTPVEMASIQQHLDTCEVCRSKLANILNKLSLADLTGPQEALPTETRDRFIKRFREETTEAREETPSAEAPPKVAPAGHNLFGTLGWIAATAALLFAAYMGNTAHTLRQELASHHSQGSRPQQVLDVLTSQNARHITLTEIKTASQPTAHVVYEKENGALIFVAAAMHPVHEDKSYELWLIPENGQTPIPAGLFRPDTSGDASIVLPDLPIGVEVKAFGVTIEGVQGAATPTLPVVMSGQ
jgi:hypothetical protein